MIFLEICCEAFVYGQPGKSEIEILSKSDLTFLEEITKIVLDSSRILPGKKAVPYFGPNNTGGTLVRPGGRASYPSFWIRDYAMALDCGFVTPAEQKHMLFVTAATQANQNTILESGSFVPLGAIADHIRIDDGKPIFFPGTYDYEKQGGATWGMVPPFGDQYFFIHMAYYYLRGISKTKFLQEEINGTKLIDRLEIAFRVPPTKPGGVLVYSNDDFRGIDFGFRDVIYMTGELCLPSILKYRACQELIEIFKQLKNDEKEKHYLKIANRIKDEIPKVFLNGRGLLTASTGKSAQPDVWSTSLAIYFGVLEGDDSKRASLQLRDAYRAGSLAMRGNIRHVLTTDDYNDSTAWEISLVKKGQYQNGGYWGTPVGWVCQAIARVDPNAARQLAQEYINDLRENDFRKGLNFGGPWECYNVSGPQNPLYLTTVACPYIVFSGKAVIK